MVTCERWAGGHGCVPCLPRRQAHRERRTRMPSTSPVLQGFGLAVTVRFNSRSPRLWSWRSPVARNPAGHKGERFGRRDSTGGSATYREGRRNRSGGTTGRGGNGRDRRRRWRDRNRRRDSESGGATGSGGATPRSGGTTGTGGATFTGGTSGTVVRRAGFRRQRLGWMTGTGGSASGGSPAPEAAEWVAGAAHSTCPTR